jgi:HlyD family secretion protein
MPIQQARRYEQLFAEKATSEELLAARRQDLAARQCRTRRRTRRPDTRAVRPAGVARAAQPACGSLSPADGVVTSRDVEPGTTVVAGQMPWWKWWIRHSLWINTRFDQVSAGRPGVRSCLRGSRCARAAAQVLGRPGAAHWNCGPTRSPRNCSRRSVFTVVPKPLPPIGERAEVTVDLPALPARTGRPQRRRAAPGPRRSVCGRPTAKAWTFVPVKLGRVPTSRGTCRCSRGLKAGDAIVLLQREGADARVRASMSSTSMPGVAK